MACVWIAPRLQPAKGFDERVELTVYWFATKEARMDAWLSCEVSEGQFPNEAAVRVRDHRDETSELFVPREYVKIASGRIANRWAKGEVQVEVLERGHDLALVHLPGQTFGNGQILTVPSARLSKRHVRQRA
jgi:hypothetical protein